MWGRKKHWKGVSSSNELRLSDTLMENKQKHFSNSGFFCEKCKISPGSQFDGISNVDRRNRVALAALWKQAGKRASVNIEDG